MEASRGAVTSAAQIRKMEFYKELRRIIRGSIMKTWLGLLLTDGVVTAKVTSILREFVPTNLEVPTTFLNETKELADILYFGKKDEQACYIVGACSGYFHPLVLDGPDGLDRIQLDAFMRGVEDGSNEWTYDNISSEEIQDC